jgi:hypothetical protein
MITIQCTKKLGDEMKLKLSPPGPEKSKPLYAWHAHLFKLSRQKCVIVMNNKTRYNFILTGLKKKEFDSLHTVIVQAMSENLLADGMDAASVDTYMEQCETVAFTATSERSLLGQINEMIMAVQYEYERHEGDLNVYETNRRLNRFIMMKLPKYSGELMREELTAAYHSRGREESGPEATDASDDEELSLSKALSKLSWDDLVQVRKNMAIKGTSALMKQDMIEVFAQRIPEQVADQVMMFDDERYEITSAAARNGGSIALSEMDPVKALYFQQRGLMFPEERENGEKTLYMPEEIAAVFRKLDDIMLKPIIQRNTEWIKLARGLLYYYGALGTSLLQEMVESYSEAAADSHDHFIGVIKGAAAYDGRIRADTRGFSLAKVPKPSKVISEHQFRSNVEYYSFTKKQLLLAGEPGYVDRTLPYRELVRFLKSRFGLTEAKAEAIVEECIYAIQLERALHDILQYMQQHIEFDDIAHLEALTDKLVVLMNTTKQWDLKGYSPNELSAHMKKQRQAHTAGPSLKPLDNVYDLHSKQKVGRNDTCPCGSGKKYKKCCGG